jgi:hypothetical protein
MLFMAARVCRVVARHLEILTDNHVRSGFSIAGA